MDLRKRKRRRKDLPKIKERTEEYVQEEFEAEAKFMSLFVKTNGFDIEHIRDKIPSSLVLRLRDGGNYPTQVLVFAKMGIHKYNFLKGKNLQLVQVDKYIEQRAPVCAVYYITLVAKDPDAGDSLVPFQTKVVEDGFSRDALLVETARLKDEPSSPESSVDDDDDSYPRDAKLPDWPLDEIDFKDKSRYYLLKKSELQEYDWIRTYTELAFLRENRRADINIYIKEPELSRLAILKVAVESPKTVERPKDRLKARNATFYVKYKYRHHKPRVGQDHVTQPFLYGIAVVRRTMNQGCFGVMLHTHFI